MNACCNVFLGSALLGLLSVPALADVVGAKLPESTSQDWNGSLMQVVLNDGSQLSEYVAKTMAGSVEGAYLAVSFIPRFKCTPVISVFVDPASGIELDSNATVLDLRIDQKSIEFPVLGDAEEGAITFTFNADQNASSRLLATLDTGSRAFFDLFSGTSLDLEVGATDSEAGQRVGEKIEFSLLGSKYSTQMVQDHCQAHTPIAFEN